MFKRCPHTILDGNIRAIVPYFFHFLATHQFPDGRGRVYQPSKLLKVFDIWYGIYDEIRPKKGKEDV